MSVTVHPTSIISKGASIGDNVQIGPYCIVDDNVKIGNGTVLKAYVRVCNYTEVGSDCIIHEHSTLGGDPQDISYKGEITWAKIGNNVIMREFVTVNRAVGEGKVTSVGDGCYVMEGVHFAHNVQVGKECTIANKSGFSGHTHIGDYVVVGGMAGFHQFVHVGSYCMIGGLSKVVRDVPPFCLANGVPLRVYDINRIGLRRRGFDSEARRQIRCMYKTIYSSKNTIKTGLEEVRKLYGDNSSAKMILDFAENSTRGLAPRISQDWEHKSREEKEVD